MSTSSSPIEFSGVRRATRGPTKVFKGHAELVTCVAHFPDGRRFASASNDKTVIIWDVESGRQDGQPLQHDFSVGEIAISPDGRRIASGMVQGGLVIWDVLTQGVVHEVNNGVWRLAYSPDGRWIATAPMDVVREVQFWEADTGRPGRKPLNYGGDVSCVAFSPDGSQIVAGLWDGSFQVNDVSTGESVVGPIKGHTEEVWSIVYSPDGRLLVTASRDSSIRTWDSKTGVEVGNPLLGHEYAVGCISITADGRRIASAGLDKTVRVWDLETRLQIGDPFDAIVGRVHSVAFSPGGRYVISGENDEVALWDTESLAIQGSSSSPTASNRNAPHRQARTKSHNDAPSINSSLLDLPAVIQQQLATRRPQERKPSVDDDFWDADSIRPPLRPTEPQQGPPHGQETLPVQLVKPGHKWLCNIREHWQRIRPRKSPVPADIPDSSSRPPPDNQPTLPVPPEPSILGRPWSRTIRERWERIRPRKSRAPADLPKSSAHIPIHERPNVPSSSGLPTNAQARLHRDADAQGNAQTHSRTRPSRNQNEISPPIVANVAYGKAYDRMAAAPPRDRSARRRWRARERRRTARNDDSDSVSEDNDAESYFEDTGCLDAFCFLECVRWWRHTHPQ